MAEELKKCINTYNDIALSDIPQSEKEKHRQILLVKIGFFQHERLIHLIVTVTFAILEMLAFMYTTFMPSVGACVFTALILILLVPYIWHYYKLENGVQALYRIYDKLEDNK